MSARRFIREHSLSLTCALLGALGLVPAAMLAESWRSFCYDLAMSMGAGLLAVAATLPLFRWLWERGSTPDKPPGECE